MGNYFSKKIIPFLKKGVSYFQNSLKRIGRKKEMHPKQKL